MGKIFLLPILFSCSQIHAQSGNSYWSLGTNPFSFVEVIPAIGPCFSYRISQRFELWSEASYLFGGPDRIDNWKNLQGLRFIFQPRYYINRNRTFFIAPEFRLKHYSYNATATFINSTTSDTLNSYPYKGLQLLVGGALLIGGQAVLSRRHHLYLEITTGIGAKQRHIKRNNVPSGYFYYHYYSRDSFDFTDYDDEYRIDPYVPLGFRLTWKLIERKK